MTFEQLDYFIAAVQCDTFLDAAETLHISQSALSKQIMKLEKELDIQLWDRSRRSAVLTEAGHMFYEEALNLSKEYRRTLFRISEFKEKAGQRLSIGTLPILSQYHLTAMLKDFADSHPLIHVFLEEVEEHDLLQGFSDNAYDLIITRSNMLDSKTHTFLPLAEDRLVAILPENHRLADRSCISLNDIAGEGFILMHSYTSIYHSAWTCSRRLESASICCAQPAWNPLSAPWLSMKASACCRRKISGCSNIKTLSLFP